MRLAAHEMTLLAVSWARNRGRISVGDCDDGLLGDTSCRIRPWQAAGLRLVIAAGDWCGPEGGDMGVAALISWLVAALFGLYLLAVWLIEYDVTGEGAPASRLPTPVILGMSCSP